VPVSIFDLFSIGIGPSSSHTVGPMRAAGRFVARLDIEGLLPRTTRVRSELFGSLGATGHGHGSYNAVLWGLESEDPETVNIDAGPLRAAEIRRTGQLRLNGTHTVSFDPEDDLILYRRRSLPFHPNGMTFTAYCDGKVLSERASSRSGPSCRSASSADAPRPEYFLVASGYGVARQSFTSGSSRIPAEARAIPWPPWTG
jgi:L-serine dehydratase